VWLGLRSRLGSAAVAWYVAELVERATSDEQPEPELYELLLHAWDLLESGAPDALVARWAELALLDAAGQGPELDVCLECGRAPVAGEALRWDEEGAGIRCASHALGGTFSSDALRLMRALRRFAPEELVALTLPPAPQREVSWALRGAVHILFGAEPKSRSFMDEVLAP
jgi:DNA repair protein RecO (recombination protein O)